MSFDLKILQEFDQKFGLLLGTDEVGRGPLAGPVISATVLIENNSELPFVLDQLHEAGVCDSKKITETKRQKILDDLEIDHHNLRLNQVYQNPLFSYVITEVDHNGIDEINIHHASLRAMQIGIEKLIEGQEQLALVLVDGKWRPKISECLTSQITQEPIIKGDSKSLLIGIASIIAKEFRDSLMKKLDEKYPGYGLSGHSGYPTPKHKLAIEKLGPSPIHRKTFKGVKEFVLQHQ